MSDIHNVAASAIGWSDRARTNHHTDIETTLSRDFMGTATLPEPVMGAGEAQ